MPEVLLSVPHPVAGLRLQDTPLFKESLETVTDRVSVPPLCKVCGEVCERLTATGWLLLLLLLPPQAERKMSAARDRQRAKNVRRFPMNIPHVGVKTRVAGFSLLSLAGPLGSIRLWAYR